MTTATESSTLGESRSLPVPVGATEENGTNLSDTERRGSMIAGAMMLGYGLIRRSFPLAALGGYLAYRGKSGHCRVYEAMGINSAIGIPGLVTTFTRSVTVNRPREEVYRFFQTFEDPAHAYRHLERSGSVDEGGVRWYLRTDGLPLRYEVEKSEERENELISFRSVEESRTALRYVIELEDAPRGRGTLVRLRMAYLPPGGGPGAAAGKALGYVSARRAEGDLRRLKQYLETGEVATITGQPSGRSRAERIRDRIGSHSS